MGESEYNAINVEIAEIERIVKDFKERFAEGTANVNDFITISQLEMLWSELQNRRVSVK